VTRDEIFDRVVAILVESFELDAGELNEATTLYDDLDLDSIDAITIFVRVRGLTGRRPDPTEAREVRTIAELVDFVERELEKGPQEDDAEELFAPSGSEDEG
jgi:acyl carrier protein